MKERFSVNDFKTTESQKGFEQSLVKVKPNRTEIERFKVNLISSGKISIAEKRLKMKGRTSENDIRDFLCDTYYHRETNAINTKDRKDSLISKDTDNFVGVRLLRQKTFQQSRDDYSRKTECKGRFRNWVLTICVNALRIKTLK
ncbi:MAG: hypothetical protein R2941_21450 [Desulfobacterales bacterium]